MNNSIVIKGAKVHNLKNINLEIPRDKLVVITGLSGSRQVFSCIWYIVCRRTETLCRKSFFICKAIFRANGKARCRVYWWAFTCNFYRPKNYLKKSAFNRGNRNWNIWLHSSSLCQNRRTILPKLWQENWKTNNWPNCRFNYGITRRNQNTNSSTSNSWQKRWVAKADCWLWKRRLCTCARRWSNLWNNRRYRNWQEEKTQYRHYSR